MQLSCQTNKKSDKYTKKIIYPSDFYYIGHDFWVLNGNRTHTKGTTILDSTVKL